jgi:two-component system chemotaxis response regulator CheY
MVNRQRKALADAQAAQPPAAPSAGDEA